MIILQGLEQHTVEVLHGCSLHDLHQNGQLHIVVHFVYNFESFDDFANEAECQEDVLSGKFLH